MKYLALGDSYTIGELVKREESFPYQLVELLKKDCSFSQMEAPYVIAKTGWTSGELYENMQSLPDPGNDFDIVTLLIGVNDQYRGNISIEAYEKNFLKLLMRAIMIARGQSRRVYVVSIPDWGATPYAEQEGKDAKAIAKEIDFFNRRNRLYSIAYRCHYLDITPLSRHQSSESQFLAEDELHYSAAAYKQWAERLLSLIQKTLPKD